MRLHPRQHSGGRTGSRSCSLRVVSMRAVVQRVKSASITVRFDLHAAALYWYGRHGNALGRWAATPVQVEGKLVSSIGPGLLCLIGIKTGDTEADQEFMCACPFTSMPHKVCELLLALKFALEGQQAVCRCKKILNLKLWPDAETGRAWSKSVRGALLQADS